MTSEQLKQPNKIPEFASREEEAEFWDTHDIADYWDSMNPVKVRTLKKLSHGLTIRLDEDTLEKVRQLASEKGIGPTTLIRMWVMEKLKDSN